MNDRTEGRMTNQVFGLALLTATGLVMLVVSVLLIDTDLVMPAVLSIVLAAVTYVVWRFDATWSPASGSSSHLRPHRWSSTSPSVGLAAAGPPQVRIPRVLRLVPDEVRSGSRGLERPRPPDRSAFSRRDASTPDR